MSEPDQETSTDDISANQTLIRDAALLQFKLIVDGLRDFLLVPASLVAALISFLSSRDGKPGPQFYQLVQWGKQSEHWIDLFGALKNAPDEVIERELPVDASLDDVVSYVEAIVVKEHKEGAVSKQAKRHIEKALSKVRGETPADGT